MRRGLTRSALSDPVVMRPHGPALCALLAVAAACGGASAPGAPVPTPTASAEALPADTVVHAESAVDVKPTLENRPAVARANQRAFANALAEGGDVDVTVRTVIGSDGVPRDVHVVRSSSPSFNAGAISVVRVMRFTPARLGGRPVAVRIDLPIRLVPQN